MRKKKVKAQFYGVVSNGGLLLDSNDQAMLFPTREALKKKFGNIMTELFEKEIQPVELTIKEK